MSVTVLDRAGQTDRITGVARVALIGAGKVADDMHFPACASISDVQLAAVCEPDAGRHDHIREKWGVQAIYRDPTDMLRRERPSVVIIATPPDTHSELCMNALEHGAHVFCEKPFVSDLHEADMVIEAAERAGRNVIVNNQYRCMPIYAETHDRIRRGYTGDPYLIQCWQQMYHPPSDERNWRAGLVRSALYEFGTHPLDLMCHFFGALPVSIMAHTPHPRSEMQADVVVQATLRFPGERLGTLLLNRISHAAERYLEMRIDCERASCRISFGGVARATLDWSRKLRRPLMRVSVVRGGEARMEAGGRSQLIVKQMQDGRTPATAIKLRELIGAGREGRSLMDELRHSRELIRVVRAGYESAESGQTVSLVE